MKPLHIFRPGTHTPMTGGAIAFSAADLDGAARAYDPALHEAPLVVGHPALNAPAYGWVQALSAAEDGLHATPRQVDAQFAAMVQAGRFKKISASFFHPSSRDNPTPGAWYLRHVGFLGAAAPAVQGLKPVAFAAEDGAVTFEFAAPSASRLGWMFSDLVGLMRGLRDRLVADAGAAEADRLMPGGTLQRLAEEAALMQAAPAEQISASPAMAPGFAAPPIEEHPVPPETDNAEFAAREAALAARQAELDAQETRLAARQAEARQRDAADFAARLVREARLPQAEAPRAAALLASLPEEGVLSFAAPAGGAQVAEAPAAALRRLLEGLPQAVSFGALSPRGPAEPDAGTADFAGRPVDPERLDLHRRALAHQAAHPGTDYMTAVLAVERAA